MRVHALPDHPRALLLDFDGTLYTHKAYAAFQNEVLIERLAKERGEDLAVTRALLDARRAARKAAGGQPTSLGNLFAELGVDIPTSVAWRLELIDPRKWLSPDPRLAQVLAELGRSLGLALVTNNPAELGRRGLEALGIGDFVPVVVGLDDCMASKPDPAPYALAAQRLGVDAGDCISVGDRYDVDIAPALALGMGAIEVAGVEDVYCLPAFFASRA